MIGKGTSVRGEVRATEDLTIEGRIEGLVLCEQHAVVVAVTAQVTGDIIARDITVFGQTAGQLVATDTVDVRAGATVKGTVVSARFILSPESTVDGRVEPQHLEAALRVARFEQKKRDAVSAGGTP